MIYLDNAATSFPKPSAVSKAVFKMMAECGANAGRAGHAMTRKAMEAVWSCREELAGLLGITARPERLIFTQNATEGLNLVIKGFNLKGRRVITTPFEHNSVARPLYDAGAELYQLPLLPTGEPDVEKIGDLATPDTALVILCHASNVSGAICDIESAARICRRKNIPLLIDAAQTVGVVEFNCERLSAAAAFSGHKGLMGPQGTGAVYLPQGFDPKPLKCGGTGSSSESLLQPDMLPDKYESGTMNVPALAGLLAAVRFIKGIGQKAVFEHDRFLARILIEGLCNIKGVTVLCPRLKLRTGTVSFVIQGRDAAEVAAQLDKDFNIACRAGLHCAPLAHKAYGTFDTGTVRFSPGWFNTERDVKKALNAVNRIAFGRI